jgi:hypothetical protein
MDYGISAAEQQHRNPDPQQQNGHFSPRFLFKSRLRNRWRLGFVPELAWPIAGSAAAVDNAVARKATRQRARRVARRQAVR